MFSMREKEFNTAQFSQFPGYVSRPPQKAVLPLGGGGLPYITDGDAHRNFQKQSLKVTILGVAPANFIP